MTAHYPQFHGFDWDDGNRHENLKHTVQHLECEQVFFNQPILVLDDPRHSVAEDRFAALGRTDAGRLLVVVYTMRNNLLRVISARDMNKRERHFYENASHT